MTVQFWKATAERALKTVVQTLLGVWLAGDVVFNVFQVDLLSGLKVALSAGVLSLLTSVASAPFGEPDSPSVVEGESK
jgi:hypothetical protein